VFQKLAGTVEEYWAMLVSYFLDEGKDMLSMYGYNDNTDITADDREYCQTFSAIIYIRLTRIVIYNMYLCIGLGVPGAPSIRREAAGVG
jgi:hypothetical protein